MPDLNLLITLDVLLTEGSVARAATRLRLSPSAMSRQLARLREATGDPLLVRAGRGLVPTPHAEALRTQIGPLLGQATALLRPAKPLDLKTLTRSFTLRTSEGFVESFGPALLARLAADAPGVHLHFKPKPDRDSTALRDGSVDLETGVLAADAGPELRTQLLFRDRFIGVVRHGHDLSQTKVTLARYLSGQHVTVSRHGLGKGPVDEALGTLNATRAAATIVGGFATALALARATDLIATVPERHTTSLRTDLFSFPLPFAIPDIAVSMFWHPRIDADPAHRWLRGQIRTICTLPTK